MSHTVFLYDKITGKDHGCTNRPELYPDLGTTVVEQPEYDEFTEECYFINGAWEIRNIDA
jgi:hypothetical protein